MTDTAVQLALWIAAGYGALAFLIWWASMWFDLGKGRTFEEAFCWGLGRALFWPILSAVWVLGNTY